MKYQAPLRHYQQLTRIVKRDSSGDKVEIKNHTGEFNLGNAYGDEVASPTDLRLRTLEELGLPARTQRRPGQMDRGGLFSTRVSSSYYHQLNDFSRQYVNGIGGPLATSRLNSLPGTKLRTTVIDESFDNHIESTSE